MNPINDFALECWTAWCVQRFCASHEKGRQGMGKTDKTDKKVEKCDKKTGKKCGAAMAFLALASSLACGCASTGAQPSRSQNINNDFRHCVVVIASKVSVSNECVTAEGGNGSANEIFTQTMKNEGSEQNTPTATPTQKTDVSPKTDVNTTGGRTAGVLETLIGSFCAWLATPGGKEATASAASACAGGDCNDGACAAGECSPSGACTDGSCSVN